MNVKNKIYKAIVDSKQQAILIFKQFRLTNFSKLLEVQQVTILFTQTLKTKEYFPLQKQISSFTIISLHKKMITLMNQSQISQVIIKDLTIKMNMI